METTLQLPMAVATTILPTVAPTFIECQTINDAPDLEQLVNEITQLQSDIESVALLAKAHGKRGLELAIKTGGLLVECQREVEARHKRRWKKWLKNNVTSIEYITVTRYIRLFEFGKVSHETYSDLVKCESIREAYYLVGIFKKHKTIIIPQIEQPPIEEPGDGEPENIIIEVQENRIDKAKQLVKQIRQLSEELTEDEREAFRKALYPLIDLIFRDKGTSFNNTDIFNAGQESMARRAKEFQREVKELMDVAA